MPKALVSCLLMKCQLLRPPRSFSVAAEVLGDETLLVGAEMDVQCLGRQWEKLRVNPCEQWPGARRVVRVPGALQAGTNSRVFLSSFRPWCRTPWLPCACAHRALCLCLLPFLEDRWAGPGPARPSLGWAGAAPACGGAAPAAAPVSSCFLNGLVCCIWCLRLLPPAALGHTGGWGGGGEGIVALGG